MKPFQVLGKKPNRGNYALSSDEVRLDNILEMMPPVPDTLDNLIDIAELLKHFKSAKRISYAKLDELEDVVGVSRAQKIYNYYHQKE